VLLRGTATVLLVLVGGCATVQPLTDAPTQSSAGRSIAAVSGEFLARTTAVTAYDALEYIPAYVAHAHSLPVPQFGLSIDGVSFVGLEPLRAILIRDVCDIRVLSTANTTDAKAAPQIVLRTRERCLLRQGATAPSDGTGRRLVDAHATYSRQCSIAVKQRLVRRCG
jgi:hypothetical protein